MNGTHVEAGYQPVHQEEVSTRKRAGGLLMGSIGGVAALALAIAGLAGAYSATLAAIATIVLGAAIWIEGGDLLATHRTEISAGARILEWNESMGTEFLGGLSGVVLGILALLGIVPAILLSVAVLVFGASFFFSNKTGIASGNQLMFGVAGIVLGLLAVCGVSQLTLVLVGLLCLSTAVLFNGVAARSRMALVSHQ